MTGAEAAWRLRTALRIAADHGRFLVQSPRWDRTALRGSLADDRALDNVCHALAEQDWPRAQAAFVAYFVAQPQRFLVGPGARATLVSRIFAGNPSAAQDAAARGDRLASGTYNLLGYRDLSFARADEAMPDWHWDPVHRRHMPRQIWSSVPYLDPESGDHKIIWELNRHQHWMVLGRAFWLTGDARYRFAFQSELTSWMAANPPLIGGNWASMLELAFRVISWTWALNVFAEDHANDETPWTIDLLLGLDRQLTHIEQHLSYYFSPNTHLLGEALALYAAGMALPCLRASSRRADTGRRTLVAESARQIAPDGSHRERSSHYLRYALDFYLVALIIARINDDPAQDAFADAVARLTHAARALADDNGRLPHFGDDDGGMTLPLCGREPDDIRDSLATAAALLGHRRGSLPEETRWMLSHPSLAERSNDQLADREPLRTSTSLRDMGYFVSRSPAGSHIVMHAGPHGYLNGGHAHADALSLTWSLRGAPVLIDPGTGSYTADMTLRERFRHTASHNTVALDDRSQSVPDGPFHWARTAASTVRSWASTSMFDYFEASHDGYAPLEHRRHVFSLHDDLLVVMDLIHGPGSTTATVYWHLDPAWGVRVRGNRASLTQGERVLDLVTLPDALEHFVADGATGLGWYSPVYGRVLDGSTLRPRHHNPTPFWLVTVLASGGANRIHRVEQLPVRRERGAPGHTLAIRVTRRQTVDVLIVAEPAVIGESSWSATDAFATDARVTFCRLIDDEIQDVGIVDGSTVCRCGATHRADAVVALPRPATAGWFRASPAPEIPRLIGMPAPPRAADATMEW